MMTEQHHEEAIRSPGHVSRSDLSSLRFVTFDLKCQNQMMAKVLGQTVPFTHEPHHIASKEKKMPGATVDGAPAPPSQAETGNDDNLSTQSSPPLTT